MKNAIIKNKAPVTIFIFNRTDTLDLVFKSIGEYKPDEIFVIADGPRKGIEGDQKNCLIARKKAEEHINWECKIHHNYSDINLGLGRRIKSGLDWVFSLVDYSIILEDDCIPASSFYYYCEELLLKYKDDARIMHISGNNYTPQYNPDYGSYFYSKYGHIWGWATWARAWGLMDYEMQHWGTIKSRQALRSLFSLKEYKYLKKVFDTYFLDVKNPWGIRWFYSRMINNGLSIVPNKNLVTNIGIIGTHSDKKSSAHFREVDFDFVIDSHPEFVIADSKYDRLHFKKAIYKRRLLIIRILRKTGRIVKSLLK